MATPPISARPDLGSLRIHDGQRSESGMGKRIVYAAIPVLLFAGIVVAAFAFRNQKAVVEVAPASRADSAGPQTALNASGYITPRRRATIAAKITGRVTGVFFDEGTRVKEGQLLATLDDRYRAREHGIAAHLQRARTAAAAAGAHNRSVAFEYRHA